ncbi:unnamed protein product [Soboliphyme baturini]|uniref:Exonuclease domain-containing protein n=1 Tax=Soboliphyme baturini TaxID=241478 RepID=A0A183IMJ4_9BILA|nr:unnamed protein product [Soboliphyme baturini]
MADDLAANNEKSALNKSEIQAVIVKSQCACTEGRVEGRTTEAKCEIELIIKRPCSMPSYVFTPRWTSPDFTLRALVIDTETVSSKTGMQERRASLLAAVRIHSCIHKGQSQNSQSANRIIGQR